VGRVVALAVVAGVGAALEVEVATGVVAIGPDVSFKTATMRPVTTRTVRAPAPTSAGAL
jgi:hypothetical protein